MERFGEKLRQLRRQSGITLQELARELGYSDHTFLSRIERGQKKPSTELVVSIAQRFNIRTDILLLDNLEIDIISPNEAT